MTSSNFVKQMLGGALFGAGLGMERDLKNKRESFEGLNKINVVRIDGLFNTVEALKKFKPIINYKINSFFNEKERKEILKLMKKDIEEEIKKLK